MLMIILFIVLLTLTCISVQAMQEFDKENEKDKKD